MKGNKDIRTLWKLGSKFRFKEGQEVYLEVAPEVYDYITKYLKPPLPPLPWMGIIKDKLGRKGLMIFVYGVEKAHYFFLNEVYPMKVEDI